MYVFLNNAHLRVVLVLYRKNAENKTEFREHHIVALATTSTKTRRLQVNEINEYFGKTSRRIDDCRQRRSEFYRITPYITPVYCRELVETMARRGNTVIEKKGDVTNW